MGKGKGNRVSEWLLQNNLSCFVATFSQHEIDGGQLCDIDADDLRELGSFQRLKCKRLVKLVCEATGRPIPPSSAFGSPAPPRPPSPRDQDSTRRRDYRSGSGGLGLVRTPGWLDQ